MQLNNPHQPIIKHIKIILVNWTGMKIQQSIVDDEMNICFTNMLAIIYLCIWIA